MKELLLPNEKAMQIFKPSDFKKYSASTDARTIQFGIKG